MHWKTIALQYVSRRDFGRLPIIQSMLSGYRVTVTWMKYVARMKI